MTLSMLETGVCTTHDSPEFLAKFKHLMSLNAAAVAIITCRDVDGRRYGLSVTSLSSFSIKPPSVLISVNHAAEAHEPLCRAQRFGVNFLREGQHDISNRFAGLNGEKNEGKYAGGDWIGTGNGVPVLRDAYFWLDCEVLAQTPILSHTVFVGKVNAACGPAEGCPSIYFGRNYVSIGGVASA